MAKKKTEPAAGVVKADSPPEKNPVTDTSLSSPESQADTVAADAPQNDKPDEVVRSAPSIGDSLGSALWIQNTSRNTIIIPLGNGALEREKIFPSRSWNVPLEHVDKVKNWLKTEYAVGQIDRENIKVLDRMPSRLGEPDLKKLPTPDAPASLNTRDDEHITEAGFVTKKKK